LSPTEYNLPDTFDEWNEIATKQAAQMEANGMIVEKVIINPQEFALWCEARNVKADGCACRKSNPDIFVMQSAEDWAAKNTPCPLNSTR
jgi:hypothetical protein